VTANSNRARPSATGSREPSPTVSALAGFDPARKLLAKVLDYYEGRKPFDFHRLPAEQRANDSFDAWQEIAEEIRQTLGKERGQ
jgi:hypothetical protein